MPAKFQRFVNTIFSELMVENKLELRLDKCKFLQTKIDYLGYKISENGVSPTNHGIEAVLNFPIPQNIREVQSFLGLCSYCRKFIEGFSIIGKPLYDLLRKNMPFKIGPDELQAVEKLKNKLIDFPVLSIYSPKDETELHCDASKLGYGATLLQRKSDGLFHPVFYFSKRTTEVESRYHSFELETLAIIYPLRRFRIYLQGIPFQIVTDCNALKLTLDKKDVNPRISQWDLELEAYDKTCEHRAGEKMRHVDAFSQAVNVLIVEDNTFESNLAICQNLDPKIRELREKRQNSEDRLFEMRNGLIYRKRNNDILFYVP